MIVNGLRLYFLAVHIATPPPPSFHFNMPVFHVSLVSQFPQVFFVHLIWKRTLEASGIGNMESQHKRSTSSSIWIFVVGEERMRPGPLVGVSATALLFSSSALMLLSWVVKSVVLRCLLMTCNVLIVL